MLMKKKYRVTYIAIGVMCLIFAVACIVSESKSSEPDYVTLVQNIALSILCSIVASVLFCMMQAAGEKDQDKKLEDFEMKLNGIDTKLKLQKELYDSGIRSIRKKSYYDADGAFWKGIIESTSNKLDLIGHSISKWFDEEYKAVFIKKIEDMLKAGKEVRIILSGAPPDMAKVYLAEKQGKENIQLTSIENTCYELQKIKRKAPKKEKNKLKVYITELSKVTYLYIRTDSQCFISPYIFSATNGSDTFLLELRTKIDYSRCFDMDFEEMIKNISQKIDLEE